MLTLWGQRIGNQLVPGRLSQVVDYNDNFEYRIGNEEGKSERPGEGQRLPGKISIFDHLFIQSLIAPIWLKNIKFYGDLREAELAFSETIKSPQIPNAYFVQTKTLAWSFFKSFFEADQQNLKIFPSFIGMVWFCWKNINYLNGFLKEIYNLSAPIINTNLQSYHYFFKSCLLVKAIVKTANNWLSNFWDRRLYDVWRMVVLSI